MFEDELDVRGDALGREAAAEQRWLWGARAGTVRAADLCNFKAKGSGLCFVLTV